MEQGYITTVVDDPHAARPANLLNFPIRTDTFLKRPYALNDSADLLPKIPID